MKQPDASLFFQYLPAVPEARVKCLSWSLRTYTPKANFSTYSKWSATEKSVFFWWFIVLSTLSKLQPQDMNSLVYLFSESIGPLRDAHSIGNLIVFLVLSSSLDYSVMRRSPANTKRLLNTGAQFFVSEINGVVKHGGRYRTRLAGSFGDLPNFPFDSINCLWEALVRIIFGCCGFKPQMASAILISMKFSFLSLVSDLVSKISE